MNWREFFKPRVWKIIILLILFLISSKISMDYRLILPDAVPEFGAPFGFYSKMAWSFGMKLAEPIVYFSYINLIIDLIFWYLLACIIVFIYQKIMKKSIK